MCAANLELSKARKLIEGAKPIEAQEFIKAAAAIYERAEIEPDDDNFYLESSNGNKDLAELFKNTVVEGEERRPESIMIDIQADAAKEYLRFKRKWHSGNIAHDYDLD